MFTSVCSRCGITNILGYVKRAHFIHDSITLTSSEFDVSSDGPLIGYVKCTHFIHDSITLSEFDVSSDGPLTMDYAIRKFLFSRSRWHSQIAFPTVLMFFLVTQVRN
ncbi:hypothetical protein T01_9744 [Trichinella spiralis]|uniref:Uncharacterized protein n=1 Tax=Trichinella spiralis TaxID=6334 RepID=A0A0V1BKE0_TRISP|nr:hypothetical protein T01_9744 [Trichinella spiralis]